MLTKLREKIANPIRSYDWDGETVYFRRVSAREWIAMQPKVIAAQAAQDAGDGEGVDVQSFYVEVVATCACDAGGNPLAPPHEELNQLGFYDLKELAEVALEHNGAKHDQKKT